jgi:hypothetical protein
MARRLEIIARIAAAAKVRVLSNAEVVQYERALGKEAYKKRVKPRRPHHMVEATGRTICGKTYEIGQKRTRRTTDPAQVTCEKCKRILSRRTS